MAITTPLRRLPLKTASWLLSGLIGVIFRSNYEIVPIKNIDLEKIVIYCLVFVVFCVLNTFIYRKRRSYLLKNGISAVAKVTGINKTLIETGTVNIYARPVMKIILEIETAGTSYRQVTIKQAFEPQKTPKVGDIVNILIDKKILIM
ncbi:hypothetical protein [Mucilaginibacter lappiensis]|uniref:hypothetical protein n=1 Tax=Mucilaginibacter lappiensis TaxID=354630 RepID=UPI003D221626